jgi:hypothetical protein
MPPAHRADAKAAPLPASDILTTPDTCIGAAAHASVRLRRGRDDWLVATRPRRERTILRPRRGP